ncbi:MAG: TetR/AcrR family transcriptional regulator [Anaerolineae bacterium]|nr:TetR/AcrR family transcriptional regulator [Anaerolineae bacterium]
MFDWTQVHAHILGLEQEGWVTRTFRRLDPDRQEAVIVAILDEAAEKGTAAFSVKDVAERAGVSVGALYTYFPNRDAMLTFAVALSVHFVGESFEAFRPYLLAMPLRDALVAYLVGGVEWSRLYMGLLRLFARAAYHGDPDLAESLVRPVATVLREMVHGVLAAAAERGELRAGVDLAAAARVIHALTIAVGDSLLLPYLNTYFQVSDQDVPPERAMEAAVDLILHGVGRDGAEEGG